MKRLPPALLATILSSLAMFSGRVNAQNLLTNGSFELGQSPGTFSQGQATYGAWTAIGNPALLGMPYAGLPVYAGTNAMHVGNSRLPGGVKQAIATKPGVAYSLSLAVLGWAAESGSVRVTVYNSLLQTNLSTDFAAPGSTVWSNRSSWFVATGTNTTIQIQNVPTAACTIDDVRVSEAQFTGSADLGLSFSASQSTFQGGPAAGFDYTYSTPGNIGVSFRARANSGTLSAYANGTLRVGYPPTVPPNASAPITLLYLGSPNGARVASDLGASVKVDGRVKFSTWLGDVNQTFPLLNKGYYLNPNKTFSPELGSTAKGSDQVHAVGFGPGIDLGVGDLSASLNLAVQQNIQFTPTNLNGTLWYTNQTSGVTRQIPFSIGLGQTVTLMATNLNSAFWDFTITGLTLQNTFSNEFSLVLSPVIDYVIDTWSPGNLPIHVFGEKFPLNFNTMQFPRAFTLEAQTLQAALTSAVDVNSLVNISSPTGKVYGVTSPNAWFSQTTTTHDGVDAARSGITPPGQASFMEATFNGPGVITYWCKVSSTLNHDFLFTLLDQGDAGIPWLSGEVNWQQRSITISNIAFNEGTHKVSWSYGTSFYGASGSDAAWVDQVVFTPSPLTLERGLDGPALSNITSTTSVGYPTVWFAQTNLTHDGVDAVRSGNIGINERSEMTANVTGPGRITFWWKISAGAVDELSFYMTGATLGTMPRINGDTDWQQVNWDIPAGNKTLFWTYDTGFSPLMNSNAAWIDQMVFTPYPFTYTNSGGKITITGYTGSGGVVTIPDTIEGLPVTGIGNSAFTGNSTVTQVILSTNVTSLGTYSFAFCSSFSQITFPAALTNFFATSTFAGCPNLTNINVDSENPGYRSVGGVVFDKNLSTLVLFPRGKSGSYLIPTSVTDIANYAFQECTSLTSVQAPYGVTSIGISAFAACTSMGNITLPRSLTSIGDGAFNLCGSLTAVYFEGNAPTPGSGLFVNANNATNYYGLENLGWGATYAGRPTATWNPPPPYLYTTNNSTITLTRYIGNGGAVNIPATINGLPVTSIGSATFINQGSVTSVTIPSGVTDIGDAAFSSCAGLTNVNIPATVTNIGISAFSSCTNLTAVTIPSGVTSIEDGAFSGCTRLASVTMPGTVTSLGSFVFQNCPSLTSLTIPGSVGSIGDGAFYSCANLTSVYFTGNAPSLGTNVFLNDTNLPASSATVFHLPNTAGWGATFGGRPTALWTPQVQISDASFGIRTNQFGFNITWPGGSTVVVETCTNLANPIWIPLKTNAMTGGSAYFSDPTWTNHTARYYRLRWP